jgi:uncharacterized protein
VKLGDIGTVNTFSISYVNADASRRTEPILISVIEIDGASQGMGMLHLFGNVKPGDVKVEMKVRAVWKPESERTGAITDVRFFEPFG